MEKHGKISSHGKLYKSDGNWLVSLNVIKRITARRSRGKSHGIPSCPELP